MSTQHEQPSLQRSSSDGELSFALQYPESPSTPSSYSPPNWLPSYESSPDSCSGATPPPFYPGDQPPPYHRFVANPDAKQKHVGSSSRVNIAHPYARLYAKKEGSKRRKIWNHALEKSLFTPHELSSMGAPHRRTIYIASLEAHVDRLHAQMISIGFFPVDFEKLEPFKGLNSKTAKSMVAGLQHDASHMKLKLLELKRSNECLRKALAGPELLPTDGMRRQPLEPKPASFNYNYH